MAWYHEIVSSLGALFGRRRQESFVPDKFWCVLSRRNYDLDGVTRSVGLIVFAQPLP